MTDVYNHPPADVNGTHGCKSLRAELDRAVRALSLAEAADLCLRAGDDVALELLGFSSEHISSLRGSPRGAGAGYPPYALRNLKATVRFLRAHLAEETVAV